VQMKYFFSSLVSLISLTFAFGQKGLPDQLKNPMPFIYSDYSHPKFYYGIRGIDRDVKSYQGVFLQAYEIIYEIGYVRSTTPVRKPMIYLGFYGFDFSMITEWEPLKCKPSDTTIQPCVHNLLSDVVISNADIIGIRDISNCELLVFNLFNDKSLYNLLTEQKPIPENSGGIFYLLWNKENKPDLPAFLSSSASIRMTITKPEKVSRKKLAFLENPSNEKTKPVTPVPPPPVAVQKPAKRSKNQTSQKSTASATGEEKKPDVTESSNLNNSPVTISPDISPALLPDLVAYLSGKKISYKADENALSFSSKNDTLFIWNKSKSRLINYIILPFKRIPVTLIQYENNRRGNLPDPESRILNRWYAKKMSFSYKGQQLYFEKTVQKLYLPTIVSSAKDIQLNSVIPAAIDLNEGNGDTIKINTTYQKSPVKINIFDLKSKQPVNGCPVRIIIRRKFETVQVNEEIYSLLRDSGDEIPDLFKNEMIKYTIILDHPDFKPLTQLITEKDFTTPKSIYLESQTSFVLLYVEPALMMREQITKSLDKRKESLIRNNKHFLLYISNTDRPLIVFDTSSYTKSIHQISMLFDDKPNLQVDYQSLINNLKNIDISGDSIKVNFYMSCSLYNRDGKKFINRLVKDGIRLVYNKEPEIYIFTDRELNNEEKIDDIKYHYYTLFKD
jgi:hypothetical protein